MLALKLKRIISNETMSFEVGVFDGNLDVQDDPTPSTNIAPIYSSVSVVPIATLLKNVFQNASEINYIKWFVDDFVKRKFIFKPSASVLIKTFP